MLFENTNNVKRCDKRHWHQVHEITCLCMYVILCHKQRHGKYGWIHRQKPENHHRVTHAHMQGRLKRRFVTELKFEVNLWPVCRLCSITSFVPYMNEQRDVRRDVIQSDRCPSVALAFIYLILCNSFINIYKGGPPVIYFIYFFFFFHLPPYLSFSKNNNKKNDNNNKGRDIFETINRSMNLCFVIFFFFFNKLFYIFFSFSTCTRSITRW